MVLLEASGLVKSFPKAGGSVEVLRGVDFRLDPGEAVAVIGPSGAGKSTLLNLLGALDRPDAGTIRLAAAHAAYPVGSTDREALTLPTRSLRAVTAWRRRVVGFVFQYHFLLPDFTALENLLLPVRLLREPQPADRERADSLLAAMGLTDRADHRPGELSGGEQQRVAVARAFMNRPRIVLADEPFGNLDRAKGAQLRDLLFALRDREGTALVIVTHDPELARQADRILELDGGRLRPVA
ncbi:MAG TPA: ABC transporter ATP-binding protein [Candidatus Krumholzibacteria bacterium]|nr:ABC transporter ATP-binding protein [Candidatus Krumholzibacteria bacterium]HPD71703.1 ABC transporter ATP-binding protein [Candidatus Krumholzibacteria bacterium]HRY41364.1 ABC transporter ATP-binding protein [Candidatus Krumholzibacteria bacterium]